MSNIHENTSTDDHVQNALELSCAVLMTLELIRSRTSDAAADASSSQALLKLAVESLREVIAQLRMT